MNWFRNRRTSTKLMLGFGLVVAMLLVVAAVGNYGMGSINISMGTMYETHALGLTHLKDAGAELLKSSRAVRNAILDENTEDVRRRISDIGTYRNSFRSNLEEFRKRIVVAENRDRAERILNQFEEIVPEQDKVLAFALAGKDKEAKAGLKHLRELADQLDKEMEDLEEAKLGLMKSSYSDAQKTFDSSRLTLLILSLVAASSAFLFGLMLARMIGNPLVRSVEVLNAVAEGDFTQELDIDSKDEVGQMATALNRAVEEMKIALTGIRERTVEVASAAEQLASASEELSSGAQEQASSLEETSASLEQITGTVKQNADSARQANQLAAGSREAAEKGGRIVGSTQTAMGEINASSKRIADIIATVDEIAFQTNLLALNAAVEAARAGEQGRGFAVVAGEVRNLAQRSAVAAKEIKALIQDSVRKVEAGTELVNRSGETLDDIVTSVKRVTDIVSEIAAASAEQATSIGQVGQAMGQMDKVTQSNTAQTEELSATAQSLSEQATRMQELVGRFKLGRDGKSGESRNQVKRTRTLARTSAAKRRAGAPSAAVIKGDFVPSPQHSNDGLAALALAHTPDDSFREY